MYFPAIAAFRNRVLHRSGLDSLLLYHSCHRRQTDQCCHQEEEYRKYFSNRTHAVCIISVSLIFRQCILSRLHIPLRIFDFFDLSLCVCNLLLCIRQLLLSICNLCLSVRDLFFRFFCCLLIFTPPSASSCSPDASCALLAFKVPSFSFRSAHADRICAFPSVI